MARAHPVSAIIIELAREEGMIVGSGYPPCLRLALKLLLDPVPGLRVDDRRMKAVMDLLTNASSSASRFESPQLHQAVRKPLVNQRFR
jgi:hypothetical protein